MPPLNQDLGADMSLAELDKMSGEPPLAKWQFVLDASSGATLRSLSAMVCRVLLTPEIVKHSEVRYTG